MSRDEWWVITFEDGTTEEVFGTPRFIKAGTVVIFEQHYGGTGFMTFDDRTISYSLAGIRKWHKRNQTR